MNRRQNNNTDDKKIKQSSNIEEQPKLLGRKTRTIKSKIPNIRVLQNNIKKIVVGQDTAVDRLILAIYRSLLIQDLKSNILVIGKSGIGKKETIKQIARLLKLPYCIVDASEYSVVYNQEKKPEDMIIELYTVSGCDLEKAKRGILVIDKIDEKIKESIATDVVANDTFESTIVKMIEGTLVPIMEPDEDGNQRVIFFDTSKIIVVLMGAFEGIEKINKDLAGKSVIGFNSHNNSLKKNYTKNDLMCYGMSAGLAAQIDTIVKFEQLSENDLADIAKNSKVSVFKKYEEYFAKIGIQLEYDEIIFEKMAKNVSSSKTGAFELANVTNEAFEDVLLKVFAAKEGKYKKCILNKDFINNPKDYVLM